MADFTSKELYMMNGGQKMYIGKDGFWDIYKATPAEEAMWAKEVVERALGRIASETNSIALQSAIADLVYHKYEGIPALLLNEMEHTTPERKLVFAAALWNMVQYENSFEVIIEIFKQHRPQLLNNVFHGLHEFKEHEGAKYFLVSCFEGDDDELLIKAQITIAKWAWSGMPQLRENNLLELLQIENKNNSTFKPAIERLKEILNIKK
jgi:hypothetical protein